MAVDFDIKALGVLDVLKKDGLLKPDEYKFN